MTPKKRTYFIDVCKTCNRLAQWPFCEHKPELWFNHDPNNKWYETIRVREV